MEIGRGSGSLLIPHLALRSAIAEKRLSPGVLSRSPHLLPVEGVSGLLYVIHKHRATSLHYDLRLEIGGTMPSWAIPKGPSLASGVRRLAMPTGDHALEYRNFEGVIAEGGYGAGPVMVWDRGTYDPETEQAKGVRKVATSREDAERVAALGLKEGNLKLFVWGQKLRGSFALVRTSGIAGRESWLLIKHRDEFSRDSYHANDYDSSAISGKSLSEIQSGASGTLLGHSSAEGSPDRQRNAGT